MKVKPTVTPSTTPKPFLVWVRVSGSVITTILLVGVLTFLYIVLGFDTVSIVFNIGFLVIYIVADQLAYFIRNDILHLGVTIAGMSGAALLTVIFLSSSFITLILCVLYGLWNLAWFCGSMLKKGA